MSVKRKLASSSLWAISASVLNNISTMVVFVALARLLTPVQFGVVAFASVFIEFSRIIVNAGIPDALIQRPDWDEDVASTAFWTNIAIGIVVSAALSLLAIPLSGSYQGQNFGGVLAALSLVLLVEAASSVHTAKLRREFQYKIIARRNVSANLIGGVLGVALAYLGWGVWAMVVSRLIAATISSLFLWQSSGFRPRFHYARADLDEFRTFSTHQLGSGLLGAGNAQAAALIIGSFLGPAAIAQYRVGSRALTMMVSLVISPLQTAAMSAFSRVNEQDGQIATAYLRVTRSCALLTCPVFFGMAATAPDLTRLLFGPRWAVGGTVMIALALVVGPATLNYFQGPALAASGRSGLNFWASLTAFLGNTVAALLTVAYGPVAVAGAYTVRAHLTTPLGLKFVAKGIGVSPMASVRNIAPPYICAAVMAAIVTVARLYVLQGAPTIVRFAVCLALGALIYVVLLVAFARPFLSLNVSEIMPLLPTKLRARLGPVARLLAR